MHLMEEFVWSEFAETPRLSPLVHPEDPLLSTRGRALASAVPGHRSDISHPDVMDALFDLRQRTRRPERFLPADAQDVATVLSREIENAVDQLTLERAQRRVYQQHPPTEGSMPRTPPV
jgi:hypothetical protein